MSLQTLLDIGQTLIKGGLAINPELQMILTVGELIIDKGIPAAMNIANTWSKDKENITLEDIQDLRNKIKEGKTYFE